MTRRLLALAASAALVGACHDSPSVPDLNNVSAETITGGLTPATAQLLATGLVNNYRNNATGTYITFPETMARDALRLDKAESRFVSEIIGPSSPDPGAFTGGGVFTGFFTGIRTANTLIDATKAATDASGLLAADRSGILGIARTIKALDYWAVMELRDTVGMPIRLEAPVSDPPADWICKKNVLAYISALLDSAQTDLQAAGAAFAVTLPSGYGLARTPAGMIQFNRGLKAKVEIYRGLSTGSDATGSPATNFNNAITALNASFMSTTGPMSTGVYEQYSTAPGDQTNSWVDASLHLNQAVFDSVAPGDLRASKIVKASAPFTQTISGTTIRTQYDYFQSVSASGRTASLPILKNEELLLLRAQAAIELNDLATATTFLNIVRTTSGGLAPYGVFASQTAARNALLYEKRYSLLMEGPQRLLDLRAYGRLNATSFPPSTATVSNPSAPFPSGLYTATLPIPINEVNARGGSVTKTCP